MVSAPSGLQANLPEVVHPSCRLIRHSPESQTPSICVSYPRPKGLEHRCSEHKLDQPHGLTAYAYPPTARPLMVTGLQSLTLWAQRPNTLHTMQTFIGYSPVFTGIVLKVPEIYPSGTFLLSLMSSPKHHLSP